MKRAVREKIREIAQRPRNVTLNEIEWVIDRLAERYPVRIRRAGVGDRRFILNVHNPGSKQVKPYSVHDFIDVMIDLGEYEE